MPLLREQDDRAAQCVLSEERFAVENRLGEIGRERGLAGELNLAVKFRDGAYGDERFNDPGHLRRRLTRQLLRRLEAREKVRDWRSLRSYEERDRREVCSR